MNKTQCKITNGIFQIHEPRSRRFVLISTSLIFGFHQGKICDIVNNQGNMSQKLVELFTNYSDETEKYESNIFAILTLRKNKLFHKLFFS